VAFLCVGLGEIGGISIDCGTWQPFVAKLDLETGNAVWVTPSFWVSPNDRLDFIPSLAIDANGDGIASGSMYGLVSMDGGHLGDSGALTGFVLKLNGNDGTVAWARKLGPHPATNRGTDVAVAPDGSLVVAADLNGDHDYGNGCVAGNTSPPDVAV